MTLSNKWYLSMVLNSSLESDPELLKSYMLKSSFALSSPVPGVQHGIIIIKLTH